MDSMIGREIGKYTITELLGEGGMAVVYKARQPSLDRDVAIKILTGPLARDEEFVTRFRREATAAGSLGHPNILTVHDAGVTEDGLHYIVMEYASGGPLSDLLRRGPLPVERACEIGAQIAAALQVAHKHGIVHRDLKPSNILLARDGRPLLMDFGVALVGTRTRLTRAGTAVGTPEYMSPEQAQGLPVGERSDIYSLGILMYEMLTGDVPFASDTPLATLYQHVHDPVPQLSERDRQLPMWLTDVIARALAKQPEERYQAAGEMAAAIRGKGTSVSTQARPVERPAARPAPQPAAVAPKPRRSAGAFGWILAVVTTVTLVAGGTYWLFFRLPSQEAPAVVATQQIAVVQSIDTPDTADETATLESIELAARATETSQAQTAQVETVTAIAMAITTAEADETALAETGALGTQDAQAQMATIAAKVVATAQAKETENAQIVAQGTQDTQAATVTSVALTAEAGRNLADSLTAEVLATQTAQSRGTQTAEAQPTSTATPRPPTSTATPLPPVSTATPARVSIICGWETGKIWTRGDEPNGTLDISTEQVHSGSYSGKLAYNFRTNGNDYVVFLHDQPLAGEPDHLNMRVFGDGSGHFLNAWIRDAQGEVWQATFGQIEHQGWELMTASLKPGQKWPWGHISGPDNGRVDYPIDFRALVLDDAPDTFVGSGAIYLDHLVAKPALGTVTEPDKTPAPVQSTATPQVAAALSGKIAFPVFNPKIGKYDVYLAVADGSGRTLVMQQARQPDFRSDGRLVVNGDGGGRDNIWALNSDGGNAKAISRHPEDSHPAWSADGGRIAFDSLLGQDKSAPRLYVHDDLSAKLEPRIVMFGSYEIRGRVSTWLSDGRIIFNGCNYWDTGGSCGLYAVGDGGGLPVQLTSESGDTAADAHGNRVAFMSVRDGNREVYVMSWDGSGQQNLTQSSGNDGLPAWSPDGEWIAFVSDRSGEWAVWAMRPDGSNAQQLFPLEGSFGSGDYDWSLERISWGP